MFTTKDDSARDGERWRGSWAGGREGWLVCNGSTGSIHLWAAGRGGGRSVAGEGGGPGEEGAPGEGLQVPGGWERWRALESGERGSTTSYWCPQVDTWPRGLDIDHKSHASIESMPRCIHESMWKDRMLPIPR